MSVLHRKIFRDLMTRRASLLALVLIMGFGISSFIGFLSVYRDLFRAKELYYRENRLADFIVDLKRAPVGALEELRSIPNVNRVRGRVSIPVVIELPGNPEPISGQALSVLPKRAPVLNDVVLRSGMWFSGGDDHEVIVTDAFAMANGLRPGHRIKVLLLDQQHEFLIVGTASAPEFIYLIPASGGLAPDPARFGAVYIQERFLQETAELDGAYNQMLGTLKDASAGPRRATLERIKDTLDFYGVTQISPMKDMLSPQFLENELENVRKTSTVTPVIFLGAAALILNVLIARLVAQQRSVIGGLKAVGYTSRQVLVHYLTYGLAIGMLGGGAGAVLGNLFHLLMLRVYRFVFSIPDIKYHFHTDLYLAGFAIAIVAACVGTIKGVRSAARLDPAAAMQPPPPEKGRRVFLEFFPALWNRMTFREKMVVRDIFRNPFRSTVSVASAIIATTLMVGAFCMRDALRFLITFEYKIVAHEDLVINLREPRGPFFDAEERQLGAVSETEPQLGIPCDLVNGNHEKRVGVTGIDRGNRLYTPVDSARLPVVIPDTGIILTRKLAEILHVVPGDFIELRPLIGERRRARCQVVGIIDSYVGLSAYASLRYLSGLIGEDWAANRLLVKTWPGASRRDFIDEVKQRRAVTGVGERLRSLLQFEGTFGRINAIIIGIFVLFACMIGFGSVLNSSLVSMSERVREVGTLRVIGYTPRQIAAIFAWESGILYGVGTVIGLFTGRAYVQFLSVMYSSELFRFPTVVRPERMVQSVLLMFLCIIIAQFIIYRMIVTLHWIEVLKIKE